MAEPEESGHLRRVLLDVGVGSAWSLRELARQSGLPLNTWQRLVAPVAPGEKGENFSERILCTAAKTLRTLGAKITYEDLAYAAWLDSATLGYGSAMSSDKQRDMAMMIVRHLPRAERLQFIADAMQLAAEDAAAWRQQEGPSDERPDPSSGAE